jgi:hypothetical protein
MLLVLLAGCETTDVGKTTDVGNRIDIKPQPIPEALEQWARQTGYQIVVPAERGCEGLSQPASGTNTHVMLDQLLHGTGLTYQWINARTVAIVCR